MECLSIFPIYKIKALKYEKGKWIRRSGETEIKPGVYLIGHESFSYGSYSSLWRPINLFCESTFNDSFTSLVRTVMSCKGEVHLLGRIRLHCIWHQLKVKQNVHFASPSKSLWKHSKSVSEFSLASQS